MCVFHYMSVLQCLYLSVCVTMLYVSIVLQSFTITIHFHQRSLTTCALLTCDIDLHIEHIRLIMSVVSDTSVLVTCNACLPLIWGIDLFGHSVGSVNDIEYRWHVKCCSDSFTCLYSCRILM